MEWRGYKGMDLRTMRTKDGMETYYDRLQRNVSQSGIREILHKVLIENNLGMTGTPSHPGTKVQVVEEVLSHVRKVEFVKLIRSEGGTFDSGKDACETFPSTRLSKLVNVSSHQWVGEGLEIVPLIRLNIRCY
jgi:hypothetical protein